MADLTPAKMVALPRWRWMPGMLTRDGWRVLRPARPTSHGLRVPWVCAAEGPRPRERAPALKRLYLHGSEPDPTDAATRRCLLELVRQAWGQAYGTGMLQTSPVTGGWAVISCEQAIAGARPTEWDALCAALAAAPEGA